jgi:hypothetical protein
VHWRQRHPETNKGLARKAAVPVPALRENIRGPAACRAKTSISLRRNNSCVQKLLHRLLAIPDCTE